MPAGNQFVHPLSRRKFAILLFNIAFLDRFRDCSVEVTVEPAVIVCNVSTCSWWIVGQFFPFLLCKEWRVFQGW